MEKYNYCRVWCLYFFIEFRQVLNKGLEANEAMGAGKQEDTELDEQAGGSRYLSCQVCGRRVKADDCSWQEDEDGIYCPDCRAERESCGCSD